MQRKVQVLLAWLEPKEAITVQLGFRLPNNGEDVSEQALAFETRRANLLARRAYDALTPFDVAPLPASIATRFDDLLHSLQAGVAASDARLGLSAGVVDLRRLICIQKAVGIDDPDASPEVAPDDWDALANVSLRSQRFDGEDLGGTFDSDGLGLTLVSANPNLRVGPAQTIASPGDPATRLIGFALTFGSSHIHVVEYLGRYFLRDGNHRCHRLLARDITHAPVIVERARSFADVHCDGSAFIAQEKLMGDRPPMLIDFFDPAVSTTVSQEAFRKVVRIHAESFLVKI